MTNKTPADGLQDEFILVPRNCRAADLGTSAFDGYKGELEDAYHNVQNYIDWSAWQVFNKARHAAPAGDVCEKCGHDGKLHRVKDNACPVISFGTPAPAESERDIKTWKDLALNAIEDLKNYAHDEGPERRMVSYNCYQEDIAHLERQAAGEGVDLKNAMVNAFALYAGYSAHESVALAEFLLGDFDVQKALKARTQGAAVDAPRTFSFDRYKDGRLMAEGVTVSGESLEHATKKAVNLCKHDTPYCVLVYRDHLPAPSSEKGGSE